MRKSFQGQKSLKKKKQVEARARRKVFFKDKVFEVVRKIPKGETKTYKEVASLAGFGGAARAVGAVLRTNYDLAIPCHRVIKSDGTLGGYNRGPNAKRALLEKENGL